VRKGSNKKGTLIGFDTLTGEKVCEEPVLDPNCSINQVFWNTQN
jgi:hypothetical protein